MKSFGYTVLASLPLLLLSCRTEETAGPVPAIEIIQPIENQSFEFDDTVIVKVNIHHQQSIDYVRVSISDEESSPVLPVQMFYPVEKEYSLEAVFVLNNFLTESGKLSINVRAGSANGLSNEWVGINYFSVPGTLESVLVVTKEQASGYTVSDVSSTGQVSERFSFTGDYSGSAVCSRHKQFYKAGAVLNKMDAWDLRLNQISWSVPAVVSPPLPYFTAIYSDNNEVFVSTRDAFVYGYSALGTNTFRSKMYSNGYFTSLIRYKTWLVAVFEAFNSTINKLVVFNYPGGTVFREIEFIGKVVSINDLGNDGLLLFMNNPLQSAVYNYNFDLNSLVKLKDFPQGNISKVTMQDIDDAFLVLADGIYWFRPANAGLVKILNVDNATDLAYEPIAGRLVVASDNVVEMFILPDIQAVASYYFNEPVVNIHLLYNK